jgi:hypothetical protein
MTGAQKKKRTTERQVPLPRDPGLLAAPVATLLLTER